MADHVLDLNDPPERALISLRMLTDPGLDVVGDCITFGVHSRKRTTYRVVSWNRVKGALSIKKVG